MGLDNFSTALDFLIGFNINLYVGEEIIKGKLMGVEADHLVIENENKYIFYYNMDKIQAITKNTRQFQGEEPKGNFQKTKSLTELLHSFRNSWISILSLNKQRFTGVLSDIDSDFATLINGDERILIKLSHVSNILKGFILEEEEKSEEKEEKDDKDKTKPEENENKSEEKSTDSTEKTNNKSENKSKSTSNETSKRSEKETKPSTTEEATISNHTSLMIESVDTIVWSEPIKAEVTRKPTNDEVFVTAPKVKEEKVEEAAAPMISIDMKKGSNEITRNDKKNEERSMSKPKSIAPAKEVKPVKEEVQNKKVEKNNPAQSPKKEAEPAKTQETVNNPVSLPKKEAKPAKTYETVSTAKLENSQNQPTKTTAMMKTETGQNNNMNVWKPKYQETKESRFAGEPVSPDAEKPFPFAGWPNRKNRTARNLFF
jgi:hypothetical protein